jgi:hypothetical protein
MDDMKAKLIKNCNQEHRVQIDIDLKLVSCDVATIIQYSDPELLEGLDKFIDNMIPIETTENMLLHGMVAIRKMFLRDTL